VARKPSDIVSPNLRIREDLRRRLENAAIKNRVSINREMINRLTDSFKLKPQLGLEDLLRSMEVTWSRVNRATSHHPNLQAELINAAEALVAASKEQEPAAITAAIAEVEKAIGLIELDRRTALRKRL
jgi:hypothetical protein